MDLIEQAVFTSAETDRSAGYQVVATSPGVCGADTQQLGIWGPSHGALLDASPNAVSFNFHPLSSGNYCVGRTAPAGWEYSGRGGARVYTQCLIVSPQGLARFANNPFALIRAALASGALRLYQEVPKTLEPLRLAGRAAPVDLTLLARLATNPGADWLASLVQAALNSSVVAVTGGPPAEHVIAGLINCLPPECRTQFSFSTGLKFSSRRPFRLIALAEDREERLRVQRLYDVAVLDFSGPPPPEFTPMDSWARFIQRVLKSGRASLLSSQFSRRQSEFAPEDLPALGLQLLEELDASSLSGNVSEEHAWPEQVPPGDPVGTHESAAAHPGCPEPLPSHDRSPGGSLPSEVVQRAHEAHPRFQQPSRPAATARQNRPTPSELLHPDDPEVLEKLERLDDLVYEAIAGKPAAMDRLKAFWPQVRHELDPQMLAESQEQYLRYALSIWEECVQSDRVRNPARAVQSLEVLCLLFDEL